MRFLDSKPQDMTFDQFIMDLARTEGWTYQLVECIKCGKTGDQLTHEGEDHPGWLCPQCYAEAKDGDE